MFDKDEKKLMNGGNISKKIKIVVVAIGLFISLLIVYLVLTKNSRELNFSFNDVKKTPESAIKDVLKGHTILYFRDYILINGKNYQIRTDNGHLMVLKDGQWIPFDSFSDQRKEGALLNQDGDLYQYHHGHLVRLNKGDIISKDGKRYIVGQDGKLHPIATEGVIWKNGKPYVAGKDGQYHPLKEGEIATVNGKKMMWKDGRFIPINAPQSNHLVPVTWENGHAYVKGDDGQDHKMSEGKRIRVNGKDYVWHNGQLIPMDQLPKGLKAKEGDLGVAMGRNGKALYWQYRNGKLVPVDPSKLKEGHLVFYKGVAYRVGADSKLHPLKSGDTVSRDGKLYTVDALGNLHQLKDGEVIDVHGKPMIYKNGQLVPLSPKDGLSVVKNKTIAWIDGKPYLMRADGKPIPIKEGQIIIRDGQAYRYVNGHFVKLSKDELKSLVKKKPKDVVKKNVQTKPVRADDDKKEEVLPYAHGSDSELKKAVSSGFSVSIVSYPSTSNGHGKQAKEDGDQLAANEQKTTNNLLKSLTARGSDSYAQANMQGQKQDFLNSMRHESIPSSKTDYQKAPSPYTVSMGTMINATLITGIDSDLPGQIQAQVSQNIYDSSTGNYLLIPQGSKLIGRYDSSISYGQQRVLMAWTTLQFPNGDKVNLQGQPGVDLSGKAGITGDVDNHWWTVFKNVLMMSVFGSGVQIAAGGASGGDGSANAMQLVAASLGQQLGQAGLQIIQKSMNIQPTINIEPGDNFKILLTRDFVMPSPYKGYDEQALVLNGVQ